MASWKVSSISEMASCTTPNRSAQGAALKVGQWKGVGSIATYTQILRGSESEVGAAESEVQGGAAATKRGL